MTILWDHIRTPQGTVYEIPGAIAVWDDNYQRISHWEERNYRLDLPWSPWMAIEDARQRVLSLTCKVQDDRPDHLFAWRQSGVLIQLGVARVSTSGLRWHEGYNEVPFWFNGKPELTPIVRKSSWSRLLDEDPSV